MPLIIRQKMEYDDEVKIYGEELECFSPKMMKKLYPDRDSYKIVGEVRSGNKKDAIDKIQIGDKLRKVAEPGAFSKILNKRVGYVCVGDDEYVVLLKSRLLFLILLFGLGVGICTACLLIWLWMQPEPVAPDNPIPSVDPNVQVLPSDPSDETHPTSNEGGGTVSMIYKLTAKLTLSDNAISMYFKNPGESNHDVVLELYIVSGEDQILIATSGRLPAGTGLYQMTFDTAAASLREGQYQALYKVAYYDPATGERALVESNITDVVLTVTP